MKISNHDVKQALLDEHFRKNLPPELNPEIEKFLKNPGCLCNHPLYRKVMTTGAKQLSSYYKDKELPTEEEIIREEEKLAKNNFSVINCHIDELASKLKRLPSGRKQIDVARYQDQVTVVVNELDS